MNARIQELEKLATVPTFGEDGFYIGTKFNPEKFAQLIIKETMGIVARNISWNGYLDAEKAVHAHLGIDN
jgi:hypothetical protein